MIALTPVGGILLSVYLLLAVGSPPVNQTLAVILIVSALVCFALDALRPYWRVPPR